MLIPGEYHGKRQVIHATSKGIGKCDSYLDCAVGIVALSHIHQAWEGSYGTKVEIVESIFAAGECQHDAVRRCLLYKFGVIVAACASTITSGNEEEMADCARFYGIDDFASRGKYSIACKASHHARTTIDSGKVLILREATKLKCLFDDWSEVFVTICG